MRAVRQMSLPEHLTNRLRLPAIAAPMFLASGPDLVVETCRTGLLGTFPALNPRNSAALGGWIEEIQARLASRPDAAPYGVNLIVHASNARMLEDLQVIVRCRVPLVITSLGIRTDVIEAVHEYGGLVFHDVVNRRHAEKAAKAGVDGIIGVCAGGGGHSGTMSPFVFAGELRQVFGGIIVLAGAISSGAHIAAALMMGADMAYLGTRFLATREAMISSRQKEMMVACRASDLLYTPSISGVHASFMRPSIIAAGLDPDALPEPGRLDMSAEWRAWRDVWSAGQGVSLIEDIPTAAELCERLVREYAAAIARMRQATESGTCQIMSRGRGSAE